MSEEINEFNLSEHIEKNDQYGSCDAINLEDVKEFIKRLKGEIRWRIKAMNRKEYTPQQTSRNIRIAIDKLAGRKLI